MFTLPSLLRRTLAVGALAGAAALLAGGAPVLAATSATTDAAGPTVNGGLYALPCAAAKQCAEVEVHATTDGTGRSLHVSATMEPYEGYGYDGGRIARVQIDSITVESLQHTVIARTGVVAPGGPEAATAFDARLPFDGVCRIYGLEVHESIRLTDGTLQHGGYTGGWFIPRQSDCPNRGIVSAFQSPVLDAQYDQMNNIEGVGVSADHQHLFAFAHLFEFPATLTSRSGVARVQLDNVQLLRNGAPVVDAAPPFGPVNSGPVTAFGAELFAVSRSFTAVPNCADYSSRVSYSVRYTDGSLRQYAVVSPRQQFCVR